MRVILAEEFERAVQAEAKRLAKLHGMPNGTGGGRVSGLLKSLSLATLSTVEMEEL